MARPPTTLERLRVFHAVVSAGTIAGAARSLDYTPSAVSQHLSALEREAGVALVERSNRGIVATDAGRLLAGSASDVLDQVHDVFDRVASVAGHHETTIAVAAFPTAVTSLLLPLLDVLAPAIRLTIVDAEAETAMRALRGREVDGAITDGHASDPPLDDVHRTLLRVEPIQLVTRSDRRVRHLADCAGAPWVLGGPRSRLAAAARQACAAAGFTPTVIAESDDHHVTFDVIRATGAVSLLPELANGNVPDGITVARRVETGVDRRVEFVTRPPLGANPAIARLTQLLVARASR
ncbi:MAG TPA: LysR family transcriptional regulator [Ilumatobacteraceae bacterium]|nr:LysR family transcriptional regulator [Ilumatobacteraceae bacterium]